MSIEDGNSQPQAENFDTESFESAAKNLDRKLHRIMSACFIPETQDLFVPQRASVGTKVMYPPITAPINPSNDLYRAIDKVELSPNEQERATGMFNFMYRLKPTLEEIQTALDNHKALELYRNVEVVQDLRLAYLLLDKNIMRWWMTMPDINFNEFYQLTKQKGLPKCLTSDQEMGRLFGDYMTLVNHNIQGQKIVRDKHTRYLGQFIGHSISPPIPTSARSKLKLNQPNVTTAMQQLSAEFPNG